MNIRWLFKAIVVTLITTLTWTALPVTPAYAATITVNTTADEDANNGNCSLREAIIAANTNLAYNGCPAGDVGLDTIILETDVIGSTYALTIPGTGENVSSTGDLDILDSLNIQARGATPAIINQTTGDRVFDIRGARTALTLERITVSGGNIAENGGGIRLIAGRFTLTLLNSTISGNTSTNQLNCGGGIWMAADPNNTINIYESTIANNTCATPGGDGGGLSFSAGTVNIRNSTFSGNQAAIAPAVGGNNSLGGAIFMGGGTLNANFVSFANNRAQGTYGADLHAAGGTVNLQHSFLVNPVNTAINCFSTAADTVNDTLIEGNAGGGDACGATASTPFADALALGDNGGPTQTLRFTTPIAGVYNAANACAGSNNVDQRGTVRPQGAACDRGAFESINIPPTITSDGGGATANIDVMENTTAVTDVDATDTDLPAQTLTYSIAGGADQAFFAIAPATGVLTFVTAPDFGTPLDTGANNVYDVTVQVADGWGGTDTQAIAVTVVLVNNAPSFTAGADQTVNEDAGAQTVNGWATGIDDGEPSITQGLSFNITNNTNPGLFSDGPSIDSAGNLTYTPTPDANGSASITVVLRDDGGTANGGVDTSAPQTFAINVTAVNDSPFFTSTPLTSAIQMTAYTYTIVTDDPDTGDTLTITASTLPSWLSFTDHHNRTATLTGTPTNADVGNHLVVLRVTDSVIATPVEQSFTIVVGDVNDAPTFTSVPVTTAGESTPYTYNIVTDDLDIPSDTLTITAPTLPSWLTLTDHHDRTATLNGTPDSTQVGAFPVSLEVSDGLLTTAQTFRIVVSNTAPQVENATVDTNPLVITFNQDVFNPPDLPLDPHDVTNPANYLLVRDNGDDFQTTGCDTGADPLDTSITIDTVTYSNGTGGKGPFVSTVTVNGGLRLSNGNYRLFVCGTTSIVDIADTTIELAGNGTPGTDFIRDFTVAINDNGDGDGNGRNNDKARADFGAGSLLIPVTGFAPDKVTSLPPQPADKAYKPLAELRIEIPTLGVNFPIVGTMISGNTWDLTWLQDSVAYLEGSAYPTLSGNTVLTAHVMDAANDLGPFSDIKWMKPGQQVYIHFNRQKFVYQVQENRKISPSDISTVFKHENYDWITLVTCEDYNAKSGAYKYRRMVRAVLISVVPEK